MKNIPKIRFKGFNKEWEEKRLGDIAEIVGGGTPSTSNPDYWNGNINWYSPNEISNMIYANGSNRKITKLGLEKSSAKMLPVGTILFSSRATIGEMAILRKPATTNQGFQSLVLKNEYFPHFIFSMKNFIKNEAIKNASGSTFLEISKKGVANINVNVPSLEEQKKIGNFFSKYDKLINLKEKEIEKLENYKKSMLENMFPKEGETVPKIRFKGFHENWEKEVLEDLGIITAGGDVEKDKLKDKGRYPVLGNSLLNKGIIGYYNDSFKIKGPAVTVTGRGEIGHARYINFDFTPVVRLLVIKTKYDCKFLALSINREKSFKESTGVPQLTAPQLKNKKIYMTSLEEQKLIGDFFEKLDKSIDLKKGELEKLENFKEGLLEKMFV